MDYTQRLLLSLISHDTISLAESKWNCVFQRFVALKAIGSQTMRILDAAAIVPFLSHLTFIIRCCLYQASCTHTLSMGNDFVT